MVQQINPPRGMRDFLPVEKSNRDYLLGKILTSYRSFGFQEIETPALENIERLTSSDGGDNESLAFRVLKRGEELEQALGKSEDQLADLGLRYDLTVPLTRFYATNQSKLPKVLKAIQTGPVWRAERPQKGRYRQFIQCDIDIIGDDSSLAEIEILNASLHALASLGLSTATIRINHRELLSKSIEDLGVSSKDQARAMITIDKLDKIGIEGVCLELQERFDDAVASKARTWLSGLDSAQSPPSQLAAVFSSLGLEHPGKLRFDPTLVRGMGYYTGIIFEIEHPESGSSIGGGGRYDGMVGKWLGEDVPAVGISLGFERVADLVEVPTIENKSLVLVFESSDLQQAITTQAQAIEAGYLVRLEPRPKKLNTLLESLKLQGFSSFATLDKPSEGFKGLVVKPIA
jgi:histidyl-tRNA synthetase